MGGLIASAVLTAVFESIRSRGHDTGFLKPAVYYVPHYHESCIRHACYRYDHDSDDLSRTGTRPYVKLAGKESTYAVCLAHLAGDEPSVIPIRNQIDILELDGDSHETWLRRGACQGLVRHGFLSAYENQGLVYPDSAITRRFRAQYGFGFPSTVEHRGTDAITYDPGIVLNLTASILGILSH